MINKNPFKKIVPEVSLPDELKEDILQEIEETIAENEEEQSDDAITDSE